MSKNTVTIVPNEAGNLVTPYKSNADFGYVQLTQSKAAMKNGWMRNSKKVALLKGDTEALREFSAAAKGVGLEGNLVVTEFVESEVPEATKKQYFDNSKPVEEQIASYIKRVRKEGLELTLGGERILHFTSWDPTGTLVDTRIQHDNADAVTQWLAANPEEKAKI